jgi:hypothetical protein
MRVARVGDVGGYETDLKSDGGNAREKVMRMEAMARASESERGG